MESHKVANLSLTGKKKPAYIQSCNLHEQSVLAIIIFKSHCYLSLLEKCHSSQNTRKMSADTSAVPLEGLATSNSR